MGKPYAFAFHSRNSKVLTAFDVLIILLFWWKKILMLCFSVRKNKRTKHQLLAPLLWLMFWWFCEDMHLPSSLVWRYTLYFQKIPFIFVWIRVRIQRARSSLRGYGFQNFLAVFLFSVSFMSEILTSLLVKAPPSLWELKISS